MASAVNHIERGARKDERRFHARKRCKVLVQRHAALCGTRDGDSHRHSNERVRAEAALVRRAVERDEEVVDLELLRHVEAGLDQLALDDVIDVRNGLEHACGV